MQVTALTQTIAGFVAIVCAGALLRAFNVVQRSDARVLNSVIIYIGLPAFIFTSVNGSDALTPKNLRVIVVSWTVFIAVGALAAIATRLLRLERRRAGGFVLAATLGNTGYIGYPLTAALLGAAAVPIAVLSDVFGTVLQLVAAGFPAARHFGRKGARLTVWRLFGELLTFPALIAVVVAIAVPSAAVPNPVSEWLAMIAKMVAPLIMLSVGISLRPKAIAHGAPALVVLAAIKLLAAPALVWWLGPLVLDGAALRVGVLEASMPSMMLTLAIGERFGLDDDFIAAAVFVTTAAAAISVPLWQSLL